MSDYKAVQRQNEANLKNSAKVIHVSMVLVPVVVDGVTIKGKYTKQIIGGTYRNPQRPAWRNNMTRAEKKQFRKERRAFRRLQ